MKHLFFTIALLGMAVGYSRAQELLTEPVPAGQHQNQHSATCLVALNVIVAQAQATYSAAQTVSLQPGFVAQAGSVFLAEIHTDQLSSDASINSLTVLAYPNPFQQSTRIEYVLTLSGRVSHTFTDLQGKVIHREDDTDLKEPGQHQLDFSGNDLPAGTYIYQIQTGTAHKSIRLIKQP